MHHLLAQGLWLWTAHAKDAAAQYRCLASADLGALNGAGAWKLVERACCWWMFDAGGCGMRGLCHLETL